MKFFLRILGFQVCSNCRKLRRLTHTLDIPKDMRVCNHCWNHWGEGGKSVAMEKPESEAQVEPKKVFRLQTPQR